MILFNQEFWSLKGDNFVQMHARVIKLARRRQLLMNNKSMILKCKA